ncbi:MAG: hypothetical protein GX282_06320 [Campylobacteraceae bacterium]|nr:hypothetical protein [Campylobacteraceae bacterium]
MQTTTLLYNSEFLNSLNESQRDIINKTKEIMANWIKKHETDEPCLMNDDEIRQTILEEIENYKNGTAKTYTMEEMKKRHGISI